MLSPATTTTTTTTTLFLLLLAPATAVAQLSTVVPMPTPVPWQEALARCSEMDLPLYRVPTSTEDPVYDVLWQQPADRYWITRRRGGSCTCLSKQGAGDLLEEAPCEDLMPAFCGS